MRYLVIGGNPFVGYTRTQTYTSLRVVGGNETVEGAEALCQQKYEECGGLLLVVDTVTGEEVQVGSYSSPCPRETGKACPPNA